MSKASEVLGDVLSSVMMSDRYRCFSNYKSKFGPGQVIERLSAEKKAALQELRSDDIKSISPYLVYGDDRYYRAQEFSEEMMKFDREVLGIK